MLYKHNCICQSPGKALGGVLKGKDQGRAYSQSSCRYSAKVGSSGDMRDKVSRGKDFYQGLVMVPLKWPGGKYVIKAEYKKQKI